MKLEELITDMKAAGCNDNTMQLARNFYLCGQKDEREACALICDTEWSTLNEKMAGIMFSKAIRARGQE